MLTMPTTTSAPNAKPNTALSTIFLKIDIAIMFFVRSLERSASTLRHAYHTRTRSLHDQALLDKGWCNTRITASFMGIVIHMACDANFTSEISRYARHVIHRHLGYVRGVQPNSLTILTEAQAVRSSLGQGTHCIQTGSQSGQGNCGAETRSCLRFCHVRDVTAVRAKGKKANPWRKATLGESDKWKD